MKRLVAIAALALLCSACVGNNVSGPSIVLPVSVIANAFGADEPLPVAPAHAAVAVNGEDPLDENMPPEPQSAAFLYAHPVPGIARGAETIQGAGPQLPAITPSPTAAPATPTVAPPEPTATPVVPSPTVAPSTATPVSSLQPAAWKTAPNWHSSEAAPEVEALAVLVMDEASGAVLHERNARTPLPPASLTKIATSIVALEQGNLDDWVTVDVDARDMPGSSVMGLRPGDRFTLRDLLFGVMLPSGNDAAIAVGRHIAGGDLAFVAEMNLLVDRLGLEGARFANPHGLTAPGHLISAYDMALLSRYAMSIDGFYPLSARKYHLADGSKKIDLWNKNGLLYDVPGADGMKVGFTYAAGRTLVASATRNGNRVYVVLLNAQSPREDGAALLEWAFRNHTWQYGRSTRTTNIEEIR